MSKRAVFLAKPPYLQIGEFLKREHGWEIYGFSPRIVPDHLKNMFSGFLDVYDVTERAKASPVPDDIVSRSRQIEDEYDLNLADIICSDRHLGIGWVTGGLYHPGRLSYMGYEKHLHIIIEMFAEMDRFLRQVDPAFVYPGVVGSFQGAIMYAACEAKRIPIYGLTGLHYEYYHYWQPDRFGTVPNLEDAYQRVKSYPEVPDSADIVDLPADMRDISAAAAAKGKLSNLLGRLFGTIRHRWKSVIVGTKTTGEIGLSPRLKYILQNYLNFKREMRRTYPTIDDVAKSDYVYFPLHFEPEAALNSIEPYFTNQMYAIELLSRSVPAGVSVVVKEHPAAVGNRPSHWMDTIAGFPRVKLVHPFENSIEIIKRSLATATITGTAGLEAAIIGKPVISMGPCYKLNFVDHVWFANDLPTLRELVKWISENRDTSGFKRNGTALKKAIEMTCFKADELIYSSRNPSQANIELACSKMLKLVNDQHLVPEARASDPSGKLLSPEQSKTISTS